MCLLIDNMNVNLQKHMKEVTQNLHRCQFFRNPSAGRQGSLLGGLWETRQGFLWSDHFQKKKPFSRNFTSVYDCEAKSDS